MRLSDSTAVIRPRNPWEAIDLGIRMVQRDFWPLATRWFIATLPWLLLAIGIGYIFKEVGFAVLLLWWLKPAFDRVILEFLSHRLFDNNVAQPPLLNLSIKTPFSYSAWKFLTYLRFSPVRSYSLPVYQLEGQHRGELSARLTTLLSQNYGTASWLTVLLWLVTICIQIAVLIFFSEFFRPEAQHADFAEYLEYLFLSNEESYSLSWMIQLAVFYVVHSVIELFYVAAGFALYLNRRTHLEAWDIELSFRRMAQRLSGGLSGGLSGPTKKRLSKSVSKGSVIVLMWGCTAFFSIQIAAQVAPDMTDRNTQENATDVTEAADQLVEEHSSQSLHEARLEARQLVTQIEQSADFGENISGEKWRLKENLFDFEDEDEPLELDWNSPGGLVKLLATIIKLVIATAILIAVLSWINRNKHLIFGVQNIETDDEPEAPIAQSEPIIREFKPDPDVPGRVLALWQQNKQREALSYLYRSSLSYLTTAHDLVIEESDTEYDCLQRVRQKAHAPVIIYFEKVTALWRRLAYGKINPKFEQLEHLCNEWPLIASPIDTPSALPTSNALLEDITHAK